MDTNWRPENWEQLKNKALLSLPDSQVLDTIMERIASSMLGAYQESNRFVEDASEWARAHFWKEPD